MRSFVSAYPWDLLDEGVDVVLDRLRGELGVGGLTLRVACPPLMRVRGRQVGPRVVHSRGGLLFKPSDEFYQATRCKPVVSSQVRSFDPLTKIAESCEAQDVELRVSVQAATVGRMAERYPEAACRNALDDTSRASLCTHNPDVQSLLSGIIMDAASRPGVRGVELRDVVCGWREAFDLDLSAPVPLSDTVRALLSLCFCESCHQRGGDAGVDITAVKRFVLVALDERLCGGMSERKGFAALLEQSGPFAKFLEWRGAERAALFSRLRKQSGAVLAVRESADATQPALYPRLPLSGEYQVCLEHTINGQPSDRSAADVRADEHAVPFAPRSAECGATLVRLVSDLAAGGAKAITFDEYGVWTDQALSFIKQAVRFGRRTAT